MSIDVSKMPKIGFGLMRLPETDGVIDLDKVCKMVDAYLDAGFSNYWFKKEYAIVNLAELEAKFSDGEAVNLESLILKGIVGKSEKLIKVLGNGDISKKLEVSVDKISSSAKEKIEKAGGKVTIAEE